MSITEITEFSAPSLNLTTKRQTMGQILVCATSCCCGRVDKGKPMVPVDWLKKEFKERRLLRHIQLTIAGCLGPCDLVNVVCIVTPTKTIWLGGLDEQRHFAVLLEWALESVEIERLAALPDVLQSRVFERWELQTKEEFVVQAA